MGAPYSPPRCGRHPRAAAGWRCGACRTDLCPGCVYEARAGTTTYPACARCRSMAEPITVPRSVIHPFPPMAWRAVRYPFSTGALLAIVGCAAVMWLLGFVPLIGWILYWGVYWAFLFAVIRQSARGATDFEPPDFADPFDDLVRPAFRGLLATAIVWVPAGIRFAWVLGSAVADGERPSVVDGLLDPGLWLVLLAGALYAPSAILHAAHGSSVFAMLNPVRVVSSAVALGSDYLVATATVALVIGLDLAQAILFPGGFGSIPFVSAVAADAVGLLAPTLAAHVLGLLLYVRGDAVGLGLESEYAVPVLRDAVPRGAEPVLQTTAVAPPPDPGDEIAAAVEAGDLVAAARLYHALHAAPPPLAPAVLYQVARGAAQAGAHALAARALHAAATGGDTGVAPDALLVLARLYQAKLGRPAEAAQVLRHLVDRYPDTAAAGHARAALARA